MFPLEKMYLLSIVFVSFILKIAMLSKWSIMCSNVCVLRSSSFASYSDPLIGMGLSLMVCTCVCVCVCVCKGVFECM